MCKVLTIFLLTWLTQLKCWKNFFVINTIHNEVMSMSEKKSIAHSCNTFDNFISVFFEFSFAANFLLDTWSEFLSLWLLWKKRKKEKNVECFLLLWNLTCRTERKIILPFSSWRVNSKKYLSELTKKNQICVKLFTMTFFVQIYLKMPFP